MVKVFIQFLAAAAGAAAGAALFAATWPGIDRFFYVSLGVDIHCEGCHTEALSLLFAFIPCTAACCVCAFTRLVYKRCGGLAVLGAFLASSCIGGSLSVLALQAAGGAAGAVIVACITGAAATAGCNAPGLYGRRKPFHCEKEAV